MDTPIDNSSNFIGLGSLLNAEKIDRIHDIEDWERKMVDLGSAGEEIDDIDFDSLMDDADPIKQHEEEVNKILKSLDTLQEPQQQEQATSQYDDPVIEDLEIDDEEEEVEEQEEVAFTPAYNQHYVKNDFNTPVPNTFTEENIFGDGDSDTKLDLLEQIETLKEDLTEFGVKVNNIDSINSFTPLPKIQEIHKILQRRYNKMKYSDIANEFMYTGSLILENNVFNGKNDFFGKKIDIKGYSDIVKSKVKRLKYETSTLVGGTVKKYNVSPSFQIMLELVLCLVTQSQRRKINYGDSLNIKYNVNKAVDDIEDFE